MRECVADMTVVMQIDPMIKAMDLSKTRVGKLDGDVFKVDREGEVTFEDADAEIKLKVNDIIGQWSVFTPV